MAIFTPSVQPAPSATFRARMQRHPLIAYFIIAFAGTWLTILPLLLGQDGLGLFLYRFGDAGILFALLGAFTGPLLAASVVMAVIFGKAGVRALWRRCVQWGVGVPWYFVALV